MVIQSCRLAAVEDVHGTERTVSGSSPQSDEPSSSLEWDPMPEPCCSDGVRFGDRHSELVRIRGKVEVLNGKGCEDAGDIAPKVCVWRAANR